MHNFLSTAGVAFVVINISSSHTEDLPKLNIKLSKACFLHLQPLVFKYSQFHVIYYIHNHMY